MVDLYPHQQYAVDRLANGKVLWGDVGTGKSLTAMAYYMKAEAPRDIYIITTAKKRDSLEWEGEAARYGVGKTPESSVAGVLTVDSWNNIGNYVGVKDAFFVFDEQRLVGSGVWVKAFLKIARANRWILLSATPGEVWMDYVPIFLANGFYSNRTDFKLKHVVYKPYSKFPKVLRYVGTKELYRNKDAVLVEMPFLNPKIRLYEDVMVDYDREKYDMVWRKRWHVYENRPVRDFGEAIRVCRRVVASHPSRIAAVQELLKKHPRLIIFYNYDYELEILRVFYNIVATAEWNGHKHEAIPDTESWVYLVQFTSGAEGWNCITTDTVIIFGLPYSYKSLVQARGRIDRIVSKKSTLYYFTILTDSLVDKMIVRSLAEKRSFSDSEMREISVFSET